MKTFSLKKITHHFFHCCIYIFIIFSLSGCYTYYYLPNRLTDLPTPPTNKVEVYMGNEQPTDKDYIKLEVLQVRGSSYEDFQSLINRMKPLAQQKGADAILILDEHSEQRSYYHSGYRSLNGYYYPGYTTVYTDNVMDALAIKYKKNVDYLNGFIKTQLIYSSKDGSFNNLEYVGNVSIGFDGNDKKTEFIKQVGNDSYFNYEKKYSIQHLLNEKNNHWTYITGSTDYGKTITRKYCNDYGTRIKTVKCYFDRQGRLTTMDLKTFTPGGTISSKEKITLQYKEDGKLGKKIIQLYNGKTYVNEFLEEFEYDQNGNLVATYFYNYSTEPPSLMFKTTFDYYKNSDVYSINN